MPHVTEHTSFDSLPPSVPLVDLNEVTLEEYRESVLDAVEEEAEMLSSDSAPHVYDPVAEEWTEDVPRPRGPIHKWPLHKRFGSMHTQEHAFYSELEASPMLDLDEKPLYDILTDVPFVSTDVRFEEEYHALEQMLEDPELLRELQSWDPAYLDPPYKGTTSDNDNTSTQHATLLCVMASVLMWTALRYSFCIHNRCAAHPALDDPQRV